MAFNHSKSNIVSNLLADSVSDNSDLLEALESFLKTYKKQQNVQKIPLSLFKSRNLGVLEVVVKYLKENNGLNYHEIAKLLNRDDRTIWSTYYRAHKKHKEPFSLKDKDETTDIAIFSDRAQAPLEALVKHLKAKGLGFKQISIMLDRGYKTIWLTNKRHK